MRESDQNLSLLELDLKTDPKMSTGTFILACDLVMKKDKSISVEVSRYPWRLSHNVQK